MLYKDLQGYIMVEETKTQDVKSEVMHVILNISKSLAKEKQGALFIIADQQKISGNYHPHYPQLLLTGNLLSKGMDAVIEKLATLDGARIFTPDGIMIAYGSRILKSETVIGFGTKHAAARGITLYDPTSTAVLVSEESGWIKVFQKGDIVLETDAVDIEPTTLEKVSSFLTNHDMALLAGAGITVAAGVVTAPALLIVGGAYMVVKTAGSMISSALKKEKSR
jgi:diadenylate cyclase